MNPVYCCLEKLNPAKMQDLGKDNEPPQCSSYLDLDSNLEQALQDDLKDAGAPALWQEIEQDNTKEYEGRDEDGIGVEDEDEDEYGNDSDDEIPAELTPLKFPSYYGHTICRAHNLGALVDQEIELRKAHLK